jgi:hypothetical protein
MMENPKIKLPIADNGLKQEERKDVEDIANSQADVTRDGGKRSTNWTPYLVDPDEQEIEHPYNRK